MISMLFVMISDSTPKEHMLFMPGRTAARPNRCCSDARAEQYAFGLRAGRVLKYIHEVPAPDDVQNWEKRINVSIENKLRLCRECSIKNDVADSFVEYIKANRHLLKNRPQTFRHGDYHIGNFLVKRFRRTYRYRF